MTTRRRVARRPKWRGAARNFSLRRKIALLAALAVGLSAAGVAAYLLVGSSEPSGPPRAAIVDQLSLTFPNQAFVEEATRTLEQAGYVVDYYPGEQVTVDFYRDLPTRDYDMLVVRAHSAQAIDNEIAVDEFLFSSEPYSKTKYLDEQRDRRLTVAYALETDARSLGRAELQEAIKKAPKYFGVASGFIESSTRGDFEDATVVLMGCDVLSLKRLAGAFVGKGADAVVGWDNSVSAGHTDAATTRFLRHLVTDGRTVDEAVAQTMDEVGPDPVYGAKLLLYAPES